MSDELKPCPFCGGSAILQEDSDHHGGYFSLGCSSDPLGNDTFCPGKAAYYTEPIRNKARAIELWNNRPEDQKRDAEYNDLHKTFGTRIDELEEELNLESETATALGAYMDDAKRDNDALRQRIADLEAAQRWIPVGERLPEMDVEVLIYGPKRLDKISTGKIAEDGDGVFWYGNYGQDEIEFEWVTHWMELPTPPEVPHD